jgi:uncharacterized tellurite resistance protein B-like protein
MAEIVYSLTELASKNTGVLKRVLNELGVHASLLGRLGAL